MNNETTQEQAKTTAEPTDDFTTDPATWAKQEHDREQAAQRDKFPDSGNESKSSATLHEDSDQKVTDTSADKPKTKPKTDEEATKTNDDVFGDLNPKARAQKFAQKVAHARENLYFPQGKTTHKTHSGERKVALQVASSDDPDKQFTPVLMSEAQFERIMTQLDPDNVMLQRLKDAKNPERDVYLLRDNEPDAEQKSPYFRGTATQTKSGKYHLNLKDGFGLVKDKAKEVAKRLGYSREQPDQTRTNGDQPNHSQEPTESEATSPTRSDRHVSKEDVRKSKMAAKLSGRSLNDIQKANLMAEKSKTRARVSQELLDGKISRGKAYAELFIESAKRFNTRLGQKMVAFSARIRSDYDPEQPRAGKYAVTNQVPDADGSVHNRHDTVTTKETFDRLMDKFGYDPSPEAEGDFITPETPEEKVPVMQGQVTGVNKDGRPVTKDEPAVAYKLPLGTLRSTQIMKSFNRAKNLENRLNIARQAQQRESAPAKADKALVEVGLER